MTKSTEWPRKTRELHNHHFDSTIWNDIAFRDGDIIVATYAKAGTTSRCSWISRSMRRAGRIGGGP